MKNAIYPAIFTYDENEKCYLVEFIDFNCSTFGKTLEEAFNMAKDALGLYLDSLLEYPKTTKEFNKIKLQNNQFVSLVDINMEEYYKKHSTKSVKKTLSIPEWLNDAAERKNINFSQLLQEALKSQLEILN